MISTPLHIILCLVPRNVDIPSTLFVLYIGYHVSLACWNDEFSSSLLPLRARICRRPLSLPEVSAEHRSVVVEYHHDTNLSIEADPALFPIQHLSPSQPILLTLAGELNISEDHVEVPRVE